MKCMKLQSVSHIIIDIYRQIYIRSPNCAVRSALIFHYELQCYSRLFGSSWKCCLLKVCQYDSLPIVIDKPGGISLRIVHQTCFVKAGIIKLCCFCHVLSTISDRVTSPLDQCVALNVFVTLQWERQHHKHLTVTLQT